MSVSKSCIREQEAAIAKYEQRVAAREAREREVENRGFVRGVALICAYLIRDADQPTYAEEVLHAAGITAKVLREAAVDPYDAKPCRKALREIAARAARMKRAFRKAGSTPAPLDSDNASGER